MNRLTAADFDQELLILFDAYVHGDIDRRGFSHFLLKEMTEAPASFRKTLRGRLTEHGGRAAVDLAGEPVGPPPRRAPHGRGRRVAAAAVLLVRRPQPAHLAVRVGDIEHLEPPGVLSARVGVAADVQPRPVALRRPAHDRVLVRPHRQLLPLGRAQLQAVRRAARDVHVDEEAGGAGGSPDLGGLNAKIAEIETRIAAIGLTAMVDGLWLELCLDSSTFTIEEALAMVEKAGFKLEASSEINANPADTADHQCYG